jgi:serine/threonine protein kinase
VIELAHSPPSPPLDQLPVDQLSITDKIVDQKKEQLDPKIQRLFGPAISSNILQPADPSPLNQQYCIQKIISTNGASAVVLKVQNLNSKIWYAAKICRPRADNHFFHLQMHEERINGELNQDDQEKPIIRLIDAFTITKSQEKKQLRCSIYELLGPDLYEYFLKPKRQVITLCDIWIIAHQLIEALKYFKEHNIAHADLKHENILMNPLANGIKIIDLGLSDKVPNLRQTIQSGFYRAPEVASKNKQKYTTALDMWSVGCILIELYTRNPIFKYSIIKDESETIQDLKVLSAITRILGPQGIELPRMHLSLGKDPVYKKEYVELEASLSEKLSQPQTVSEESPPTHKLREWLKTHPPVAIIEKDDETLNEQFIDLLCQMLQKRPEARITPEDALKHPFITTILNRAVAAQDSDSPPHSLDPFDSEEPCFAAAGGPYSPYDEYDI